MTSAVRIESVSKSYLAGSVEVFALRGIDLEIEGGSIVGIMGPSGSGKTTLLNILGGIDRPTAGNVFVDGTNVGRLDGRDLDTYRCTGVGSIFQFFNLVPSLTARQNVEVPMVVARNSDDEVEARASNLLELVGLRDRDRRLPSELSGGEQQRVAVAVALANDPPLLLADEPTGELDSEAGEQVIGLIVRLSRELHKTVVIATHDGRLLGECDTVWSLRDGRIEGRRDSPPKSEGTRFGNPGHA